MRQKTYLSLVSFLFLVIGVLHLYRAFKGYELVVGNMHIASSWSWLGALVALYLAYQGYKHNK